MRQGFRSVFQVLAVLLAATALLFSAVPCDAATADGKLRVKNVEVRGTKVRLPIPDEYEEMRREDSPELYDKIVKVNSDERVVLLLAVFIHSGDKLLLQQEAKTGPKFIFVSSYKSFWNAVISHNRLGYFKEKMNEHIEGMHNLIKEVVIEDNEILLKFQVIYNGIKSIAYSAARERKVNGEKYKTMIIESYIVLDKKVVSVNLHVDIHDDASILENENAIISYLKRIDEGRF